MMFYYITVKFLFILLLTKSAITKSVDKYDPVVIRDSVQAEPGHFPAMVDLSIQGLTNCGGVLIDLSHIVTAGHCLVNVDDLSDSKIIVTGDEISLAEASPSRQTRTAIYHIIHPHYFQSPYKLINDIAVLRVTLLIILYTYNLSDFIISISHQNR